MVLNPTDERPDEPLELSPIDYAGISPYLVDPDSDITFEPPVVTRLGGTLPWDMERDQTLCGESIVETDGDFNSRIVMEGYIGLQDLADLFQLRANANEISLRWEGVDATGISSVTFDQLKWDRRDEEDLAHFDKYDIPGPLYSFQLQSKEDSESE